MCPKNDDPLTTGQGYRTIKIAVQGGAATVDGTFRISFNGQTTTLSATAPSNTATLCANAFMQMRNVMSATCAPTVINAAVQSAEYVVAFTEWTHLDAENNLLKHNGNPPLSSFKCDISQVVSTGTPTCVITDVVATNVIGKQNDGKRIKGGATERLTDACT